MPEAVVVAATRSPIGRAFKGSLKDVRPDDLAATIVRAALDKVPELSAADIDDLYLGCAEPWGEHGSNMARVVAVLLGYDHLPGATVNRFCSSSVQTTRMAFHAIKAGEGDVFVSAGVECVSRYKGFAGAGQSKDDWLEPRLRRGAGPHQATAGSNETWHDPRAGAAARRLHRHGADRGERRDLARRQPASPGRVGRREPEPGREGHGRRVLRAGDHSGDPARRVGR